MSDLTDRLREPKNRQEILGRLGAVEQGKPTKLERQAADALDALAAEVQQLREALERIVEADGSNAPSWWGSSTSHLRSIARAALAGSGRAGDET